MNGDNSRTVEFLQYLSQNGIDLDDLSQFEGCQESLTLKRRPCGHVSRLTIASREFVARPMDGNHSVDLSV